jgi:hypothetical protein
MRAPPEAGRDVLAVAASLVARTAQHLCSATWRAWRGIVRMEVLT